MTALEQTIQNVKDVFVAQGYETPECYLAGKDNKGNDLSPGFMDGLKPTLIKMAQNKKSDLEIKNYDDHEKIKETIAITNRALDDNGKFTLANFYDDKKNDYYNTIQEKKSVMFYGKTGHGKTHIASALCRALIVKNLETERILDLTFFDEMRTGRFDKEFKNKKRRLKHVSVLFFDEIGKTPVLKDGVYNEYGRLLLDIFGYRENKALKKNIIAGGFKEKEDIYKFLGDELYRKMFFNGSVEFYKLNKRG
jgi:DNA replication protein DnaC